MKQETQQLLDYIKSTIQTCEDADRKTLAETKAKKGFVPCPMKDGYASGFEFRYEDGTYGDRRVYGFFEYKYKGFERKTYSAKDMPFASLSFLTEGEYENEMLPALISWLEEKVKAEPFGGIYRAKFCIGVFISDRSNNYARSKKTVPLDSVREESQREMVCAFLRDGKYKTMDFASDEFKPVTEDLFSILPTLFGRLPVETLKDAIDTMIAKYTQYDTHGLHINNDVLFPLSFGCLDKLRKWATPCAANKWALEEPTDTKIPNEELDYLCWIGLQILSNADDGSTVRKSGQDILNWVSRRGYARAKDYLKFGTGNIGKEYTYQKTPKFEAIANDIDCLIEFKVKEEDAESYGGMLDFLVKLLKQGFPADHQIKINSKLKNYIPVDGLNKKSKTNLFFGNASTFTELWGKMAEYVRTVFDPYTYHSDSSEDEAVTVGGYAVYALGVRDMAANLEIVKEFMSNVDLEHDCTAKAFAQEYMNK